MTDLREVLPSNMWTIHESGDVDIAPGVDDERLRAYWYVLCHKWGVRSNYSVVDLAPPSVKCKACWDFKICPECLGYYPTVCPDDCCDGVCAECKPGPNLRAPLIEGYYEDD